MLASARQAGVLILLVVFGLALFTRDVIPVLPERQHDFATLSTITPPISWFPSLLTILGLLVIMYAVAMIVLTRKVEPPRRKELR